jgi:hypothetical protein
VNKILFLVTFLILLALFIHPIDVDGDFYHHMNVGKYILTHHSLPRVDDLTFTAVGRTFMGNGWFSGIIFYVLYPRYGAIPVNILNVLMAVSAFTMAFWYLHRCLRVSLRRSILSILVVAPVVATRWPYRPEMFMYVFVFSFFLIDHYKDKKPWLSLLIPVLVLLDTFLYGAGFPLIAGVLVLLCVHTFIREKRTARNWLYYVCVAISFPVALFNGYGIQSLFFINLLSKWTTLWGDWIGLWQLIMHPEVNFSREIIYIYSLFTLYCIGLGLLSWKTIKRYPVFALLALVVVLPFMANRVRTFAGFLCIPFIGVVLAHTRSRWLLYSTGLVASVMIGCYVCINPPGVGEDAHYFPPKLIQFIRTNSLKGNVFNTPRIGAFLSYYLAPDIKVFSDTRDDLFVGTGVLEATQAFLSKDASISFLLRKYNIDMIIVSSSDGTSFRDLIYDPQWALVYYNNPYLMFIPRSVAIEKQISIYDTVDPYSQIGEKTRYD